MQLSELNCSSSDGIKLVYRGITVTSIAVFINRLKTIQIIF